MTPVCGRCGERRELDEDARLCMPCLWGRPPVRLVMAYADPPYLGCCNLYDHHHPDGRCWDDPSTHGALIERLEAEYPDGWALSLSSPSTHVMLDHCRAHGLSLMDGDIRLCSWVKPFAAFKANVRVAYAWEPLIVKPARRLDGAIPTRDYVACPITMQRGLTGAKPEIVCQWLFAVMGLRRTDDLHDLFHGSGAVKAAWQSWVMQLPVAA